MTNEEVIARARELRPLIYQNIQQDVDERGVLVLFTESEPYTHYAFVRFVEDMETTDATDHATLEWLSLSDKLFDAYETLLSEKTSLLESFRETIITNAERFFSVFETGDKEVPEFAEQEWLNLGMALRFYQEEGGEIK